VEVFYPASTRVHSYEYLFPTVSRSPIHFCIAVGLSYSNFRVCILHSFSHGVHFICTHVIYLQHNLIDRLASSNPAFIFRPQKYCPSRGSSWFPLMPTVRLRVRKRVNFSLCLTKHYSMKTYGGVDAQIHVFLTSALFGSEWCTSCLCRFTLRKKNCWCPLDRRPSGTKSRSGQYGGVNILDIYGARTPTPRSSSL
jgi:hypothetical protein